MKVLTGHAYLLAGTEAATPRVLALLESEGVNTAGNPDVYARTYRQFGVEEARELRERASARAVAGARRIFIVAVPGMTAEAQNALLKTLEEPPADAMFFIIVPSPEMLLPTLRSRMQRLELSEEAETLEVVDTKKFLSATPEKRLDMLKPLLEKGDDEKRDIGAILAFLSSLERGLAKHGASEGVRSVYRARKYAGDKGALVKPLLEQVALLIPKM